MPDPIPAPSVSLEIPKSSTLTESWPSDRRTQKRFAGFQIPMNNSKRMGIGHRDARLKDELDRLLDG